MRFIDRALFWKYRNKGIGPLEIRRGLHLRFESHRGTTTIRLKGYRFDGKQWCTTHNYPAPRGEIFVLGCDCGAQEWQDNGRDLNELECGACGQFIQVEEMSEREAEALENL